MIEWIKKNIISIEFSFTTFRNRTVESITAGLSKTVADLEAHAAEQIEHMRLKTEAAAKALKERAEHEEEHLKATKVYQNLKALLG